MTRIYFADKVDDYLGSGKKQAAKGIMQQDSGFKTAQTTQPGFNEDSVDAPSTGKKKKASDSWGSSMRGLFNMIAWVSQHGVYRIFNRQPFELLNGWGHLFGMLLLGRSKSVRRKIRASFQALYPHWSRKQLDKYTTASIKYFGSMFLDFMFRLPHTCDFPDKQFQKNPFYTYEGIEKLDAALAKGKGVIVTMVHMGEFFHSMAALFQHPKHYYCGGVAAVSNLVMYRMNNRKHFDGLHIFASTDFSKISGPLERFLRHNGILAMAHDYASPRQLRAPLIYGQNPYLVNVPQSYISLQQKTGAEIVPCFAFPNNVLGKSRIVFLDNTSIMDVIQRNANSSKKQFHGELSTELNRVIYPIVKSYAHNWEEIMNLASMRLADKQEFPANCTIRDFTIVSFEKMRQIIDNSYEPGRNDEQLLQAINKTAETTLPLLKTGDIILRSHATKIILSQMDALSELKKIVAIAAKELAKKGEHVCAEEFLQLNRVFTYHSSMQTCYRDILVEEKIDLGLTARIWEKVHTMVDGFWNYEEILANRVKTYEDALMAKFQLFKIELKTKIKVTVEIVKQEYLQQVKSTI